MAILILQNGVRVRTFMHSVVNLLLVGVMGYMGLVFSDHNSLFTTASTYHAMIEVASQTTWAVSCHTVSMIGLVATFTKNWRVRVASAVMLATSHLIVAIYLFLGNPHGPGYGLFAGYAILALALAYSTAHMGVKLTERVEAPSIPG